MVLINVLNLYVQICLDDVCVIKMCVNFVLKLLTLLFSTPITIISVTSYIISVVYQVSHREVHLSDQLQIQGGLQGGPALFFWIKESR